MAQFSIADLMTQSGRLGLSLIAGPSRGAVVERVEITQLESLGTLTPGTLAIVASDTTPPPYLVDVSVRQASALRLAGIIFTVSFELTETVKLLAFRGEMPLLVATGIQGTELAVAIDRIISGGAAESMTRAAFAIEQASENAASLDSSAQSILDSASTALGVDLRMHDDPSASWTDGAAVFVGEVPVGRIQASETDVAASVAVPVIASLVSRVLQRQMRERFASTQSRADLIIELVLAETARVDAFMGQAGRLGLPLHLSHVAAILRPHHRSDPELAPSHATAPAVELFALQLFEERPEMWHIAYIQHDALIVSTEEHGAGDHQRRLGDVASTIQRHAQSLAGDEWTYTLGLGTPQTGAAGLRQSAAEARMAAESAIAAGRLGGVETTDVTGLRRVLLDFYASPISRRLLQDILHSLDALGPERSMTAVRTLVAYLGARNSLVRAGERLMLHPNAVAYRLRWIKQTLALDLDDPDIRFAVELACRVRLLRATAV